jgi:hypothetical protein
MTEAASSDMREQRKWRIVVQQHPVTATHLRALGRLWCLEGSMLDFSVIQGFQ